MRPPTEAEAKQFALMLFSGIPAATAVSYFQKESADALTLAKVARAWAEHTHVQTALRAYRGGSWHELTAQQRLTLALEKHYQEMAFYLFSHNVGELEGGALTKATNFRTALEAKLAGTAGKDDPLSEFIRDVIGGKLKLTPSVPAPARVGPDGRYPH